MRRTDTELITRRARLTSLLLALLLLAALLPAAPARADGDPASDALISQNVFYPYSVSVSGAAQAALNRAVSRLHDAGLPLKVALIARPQDLGSITALYGRPGRYAAFLDTEISYGKREPLIVVMPNGFGVEGLTARETRAVLATSRPAGGDGVELARAATRAAVRIGTPSRGRAARTGTTGTSSDERTILLLALVLAAILVAGALILLRVFSSPAARPPQGRGGKA